MPPSVAPTGMYRTADRSRDAGALPAVLPSIAFLEESLGRQKRFAERTVPIPAPGPLRLHGGGGKIPGFEGDYLPGDVGRDVGRDVIEEQKQDVRQNIQQAEEHRMGRFIDKFTAGLAQGLRGE